jgi:hypothetical protein
MRVNGMETSIQFVLNESAPVDAQYAVSHALEYALSE